tara:strand:- start:1162 stop:1431 length:270 start_codon:yes stop_codon:yes gene_type:complete
METVDNIHYLTQDQWRDKYKMLQRENSNLLVLLKNEQLLVEEKVMVIKLKDIEIDQVRQANKRLIRSYAELRTRLENILKYDLLGKPGV